MNVTLDLEQERIAHIAECEKLAMWDSLAQIEEPMNDVWGAVNALYDALGREKASEETINYLRGQLFNHAHDMKQAMDEQIRIATSG